MRFIADLHLHSKYSRATSKDLDIPTNAQWAKWKGINLVGTGDFTHPIWVTELKEQLVEDDSASGLFRLNDPALYENLGGEEAPRFMLTVETAHIYSENDQTRRIHIVTFAPSFETVDLIQQALVKKHVNITSDGRPIMGMSCPEYMDLVLTIDDSCMIVPAHIWTPWFSMFGSMSGFDSIDECFHEFAPFICAIETGLSSDPLMNWQIKELDNRSIVSFSDAHSPSKLGREVTIIEGELSYKGVTNAIRNGCFSTQDEAEISPIDKIAATVEFYPEEGKYHFNGHRKCDVCQSPQVTKEKGEMCPVCGKKLTLGVMQRVLAIAERTINLSQLKVSNDDLGVRWIGTPKGLRPPYTMMVPLQEIISEVLEVGVNTKSVMELYHLCVQQFGSEFNVLLNTSVEEIKVQIKPELAEAIRRVRSGEMEVSPGYDGEFGTVHIFKPEDRPGTNKNQTQLF